MRGWTKNGPRGTIFLLLRWICPSPTHIRSGDEEKKLCLSAKIIKINYTRRSLSRAIIFHFSPRFLSQFSGCSRTQHVPLPQFVIKGENMRLGARHSVDDVLNFHNWTRWMSLLGQNGLVNNSDAADKYPIAINVHESRCNPWNMSSNKNPSRTDRACSAKKRIWSSGDIMQMQ